MSLDADKNKALDAALKQIEKDFGKGSIMKLGAASAKMNIETIPTGALSLDIALGVGGIPRGRIIEIYGPESSGKPRKGAATQPSSMRNTPWIQNMPGIWEWISTTC